MDLWRRAGEKVSREWNRHVRSKADEPTAERIGAGTSREESTQAGTFSSLLPDENPREGPRKSTMTHDIDLAALWPPSLCVHAAAVTDRPTPLDDRAGHPA